MKRISFDFDGTLSRDNVFEIAKQISSDFELWIVTSRCTKENYRLINLYYENNDLFEYADKLGIPDERIIFTNLKPKYTFFSTNLDFIAHLDDDHIELEDIDDLKSNIVTINVDKPLWYEKLNRLLI